MKRLVIYLAVTFGLSWGLLIPAGFTLGTFENGEGSSVAMVTLIALSMFFPLVGALVANFACAPEERIDLCWKPRIRQSIPQYLAAWFLPTAITLVGGVLFFALMLLFLHPAGVGEYQMFWVPWMIGGIACGIAAIVMSLVRK